MGQSGTVLATDNYGAQWTARQVLADNGVFTWGPDLYALDTVLELPAADANKESLLEAMEGHILDQGQLMGIYEIK